MIKWTFAYEQDYLSINVLDEKEDTRIAAFMDDPEEFLFVPAQEKNVWINLSKVKIVSRETVDEKAIEDVGIVTAQDQSSQS
jgi:hypothetical protein